MSTSGTPYRLPNANRKRRPAGQDNLFIVGVTGGMSAGKSSLVKHFVDAGARHLSADRIGHEVLEEKEVRNQLVRAFGSEILDTGGKIDRKLLGEKAFVDSESLRKLNAISHPRLLARLRDQLDELAREGRSELVVLEAALLMEWDLGPWCDRVVEVTAPLELRLDRAVGQHGITEDQARDRMERQLPEGARLGYADHSLINDGSPDDLERRTSRLIRRLQKEWREVRSSGSTPKEEN